MTDNFVLRLIIEASNIANTLERREEIVAGILAEHAATIRAECAEVARGYPSFLRENLRGSQEQSLAAEEIAAAIESMGESKAAANGDPYIGTMWRHIKTGHLYVIVGTCRLEHSGADAFLYRRPEHGPVWARDRGEFLDGRFEGLEISK